MWASGAMWEFRELLVIAFPAVHRHTYFHFDLNYTAIQFYDLILHGCDMITLEAHSASMTHKYKQKHTDSQVENQPCCCCL